MIIKLASQKGMTLIELLIGLLLTATVGLFVGSGFILVTKTKVRTEKKGDTEVEVSLLHLHVQSVGRHATRCGIDNGGNTLICEVDNGGNRLMRFDWTGPVARTVNFLQEDSPGSGVFAAPLVYRGITSFLVCDDAMMLADAADSGNRCPFSQALARQHVKNLNGDFDVLPPGLNPGDLKTQGNRFFLFQVKGLAEGDLGGYIRPTEMSGSFYVRNPTPRSLGYAAFKWGTRAD